MKKKSRVNKKQNNINPKLPSTFILVGFILGLFSSSMRIIRYFLIRFINNSGLIEEIKISGINLPIINAWSLVLAIIFLALNICLLFIFLRIKKHPSEKDYIIVTIIGGAGLLVGAGFGGLLVLAGGILGIVKYKK